MPVWISHRGVRDNQVVENTRVSFAAAVRKGFKVLETDLQLTADHHIVLSHDDNFSTLIQDDRPILTLTRAQIELLTYSDGQHPYFLDQFMDDQASFSWVFDLKPPSAQATVAVLARMVSERMSVDAFVKKTSFVVWCKSDEEFLEEKFPGAKVFARESECWRAGLSFLYFGGLWAGIKKNRIYSVAPKVHGRKLFTKEFVEKYQKRGGKVLAFLPQSVEEAKDAKAAGFDEILSDGWIVK
jgi:glycerophosphoryl diester phosphodiesterase